MLSTDKFSIVLPPWHFVLRGTLYSRQACCWRASPWNIVPAQLLVKMPLSQCRLFITSRHVLNNEIALTINTMLSHRPIIMNMVRHYRMLMMRLKWDVHAVVMKALTCRASLPNLKAKCRRQQAGLNAQNREHRLECANEMAGCYFHHFTLTHINHIKPRNHHLFHINAKIRQNKLSINSSIFYVILLWWRATLMRMVFGHWQAKWNITWRTKARWRNGISKCHQMRPNMGNSSHQASELNNHESTLASHHIKWRGNIEALDRMVLIHASAYSPYIARIKERAEYCGYLLVWGHHDERKKAMAWRDSASPMIKYGETVAIMNIILSLYIVMINMAYQWWSYHHNVQKAYIAYGQSRRYRLSKYHRPLR